MTDIHVTWDHNPTPKPRTQKVQSVCAICHQWRTVGKGSGTITVNPNMPHKCKTWTRLGPITKLINTYRKRKGLPPSNTLTYRTPREHTHHWTHWSTGNPWEKQRRCTNCRTVQRVDSDGTWELIQPK